MTPPLARPGAHGGDGARLAAALGIPVTEVLDLSASLNPVAPDPRPIVGRHLDSIRRYPDEGMAAAALAEAIGVDESQLVVTNGGSEAIALVARDAQRGWVAEPEFSLYRRHLTEVDPAAPRWRSNPNNPTGLLASSRDVAGVWDEAFWPLATGTWTRGDVSRGAMVVGSLTKLFACPGLRAGYVICHDDTTAARLRNLRPEWSLNSLAAGALPEMVGQADLALWAKQTAELRDDLADALRESDLDPRPSDANWLLVDPPDPTALREHLATQAILVRDCTTFGMPGTLRIAVPDAEGIERLAGALRTRGRPE